MFVYVCLCVHLIVHALVTCCLGLSTCMIGDDSPCVCYFAWTFFRLRVCMCLWRPLTLCCACVYFRCRCVSFMWPMRYVRSIWTPFISLSLFLRACSCAPICVWFFVCACMPRPCGCICLFVRLVCYIASVRLCRQFKPGVGTDTSRCRNVRAGAEMCRWRLMREAVGWCGHLQTGVGKCRQMQPGASRVR